MQEIKQEIPVIVQTIQIRIELLTRKVPRKEQTKANENTFVEKRVGHQRLTGRPT